MMTLHCDYTGCPNTLIAPLAVRVVRPGNAAVHVSDNHFHPHCWETMLKEQAQQFKERTHPKGESQS